MNLASLRTQAAFFVGDKNLTRYTPAEYLVAINRAQEQFVLDSKALFKDMTPQTTAAGTSTYPLPTDFMWEDWLKYDGIEIKPISRHDLQLLSSGQDWTLINGTPTHYIIDPEEAAKVITLYPNPVDAKVLGMRYYPLPAELSADGDVPLNSSALMAQFHLAICAYAAWLLLSGEDPTPAIAQKMGQFQSIYSEGVSKAIDTFKNTVSAGLKIRGIFNWG